MHPCWPQLLQELNPVPFAVTFASTACWNAYGFAAPDYNMFLPNIPGFAAAIFTTVSCYALASLQVCARYAVDPAASRPKMQTAAATCVKMGTQVGDAGCCCWCIDAAAAVLPQVQNLLLSIMCGSSVIILLLGVMTRFVMSAQQARLIW